MVDAIVPNPSHGRPKRKRFLLIANECGRRRHSFSEEWERYWNGRQPVWELHHLQWSDVIARNGDVSGLIPNDCPAVVRLESPGEDFHVTRELLRVGQIAEGGGTDWSNINYQLGRLLRPGLLHRGFRSVLQGLHESFTSRPDLEPLSCPLAVAEMFDKNRTSTRLQVAGLPVPESFAPPVSMDADRLLHVLKKREFDRAYVKLATGSSATGIAVVQALDDPPWALTSVLRRGEEFFNSLRILRVEGEELRRVLNFIVGEGACVQRGIPMARIDGQNFDVRVIVIEGEPAFTIFRLSSDPMTNLHFGGRRGQTEYCRSRIPKRFWLDAMDDCVAAAELYDASMVGIDFVFECGSLRHSLLEVNAFGDFFPGWTDDKGRTIHRVEIEAIAERLASRAESV